METILTAIIAATGAIVGTIISNHTKQRALDNALAKHEQHQEDDIAEVKKEQLEIKKRLDSHNGYAEKFAKATIDIALTKKDVAITQKDVAEIKEHLKSIQMCRTK